MGKILSILTLKYFKCNHSPEKNNKDSCRYCARCYSCEPKGSSVSKTVRHVKCAVAQVEMIGDMECHNHIKLNKK